MSGVPYHAWTHAPKAEGGTDPIERVTPYFRAWQYEVVDEIPDTGDPQRLAFDRWQTSSEEAFEPTTVHLGTPDFIRFVDAKTRGLYIVNFSLEFATNPTTGVIGLAIEETSTGSWTEAPTVLHPAQPIAGDATTGHYSMSLIRSYPPIWVAETTDLLAPAIPTFSFNVAADGVGGDLETFQAMFEIHRLTAIDYEANVPS